MRPSFPRLIRILPKTNTPAIENYNSSSQPTVRPTIIPPPLTWRDEASARVTLTQKLLQRKVDGLAKEARGELEKGAGWPPNLRVALPITKKLLRNVDETVREDLRDITKET